MIGLDTRNLLRLLLKYDEEQSAGVVALLEQPPEIGPGHVDRVTLLTTG
ncbi:hypothetical protein [Sinorhizobium sp. BG8]|nr:hypothetical protein [Sinorhizobium sp. BG8]QRM56597.1 type II toxin-antitoxin system VapC family toxin [Sinorhizobium sp. BG8]